MLLSDYFRALRVIDNEGLEQIEPFLFKKENSDGSKRYHHMNKKVRNIIYTIIDMDKRMSEKLYGYDYELWRRLFESVYDSKGEEVLSNNYVEFNGYLIDTIDDVDSFNECIDSLCEKLDSYRNLNAVVNSDGTIVSVISNLSISLSVLFVTINFVKSVYSVHQGTTDSNGCIYIYEKPYVLKYD